MATKHTHQVVFGNKVDGCPRCAELLNGAAPIQWASTINKQRQQQRIADIRAHNCRTAGCGPVCTAFDW